RIDLEVIDEGLVDEGKRALDESLVIVTGAVRVERGLVLEGEDEGVGEAAIEPLRAVVPSPLEAAQAADASGKLRERLRDRLDLAGRRRLLELEEDDVVNGLILRMARLCREKKQKSGDAEARGIEEESSALHGCLLLHA